MAKPILCLDFDGVLHSYTSGWQGARRIPDPPVPGAIDFLDRALRYGFDVVIHSSRCRYFGGKTAIRAWLRQHAGNLYHEDAAGGVGIERVRVVSSKPPALVTLDDRALTFTGVWPSLDGLRAFKPWYK